MEKRALKVFLMLCRAGSAVLEAFYIILARVTGVTYDVLILLLMWGPGITGIICTGKYFPKQNYLGIRIKGGQYIFYVKCGFQTSGNEREIEIAGSKVLKVEYICAE